ncbi:hypothetical protein ABIE09_002343 [Lysobacter enzymogenes]|uniref:hypothetical protein n=1 Tax=Lysobacter enzymogenes TaxID=69 RepID=UPI003396EAC2
MSLKNRMAEITQIARAAQARDEELQRKHGVEIGLLLGDPATAAYMADASETAIPLRDYLSALKLVDLKKLVTLMYAGRDVNDFLQLRSLRKFHDSLTNVHDATMEVYIRIMSEKIFNLPHYFDAVIEHSRRLDIDPDKDLLGVA